MKKQVLVSVDAWETRVALLEQAGTPTAAKSRRPKGAQSALAGYRVAELYLERRGSRSIVGNVYKGKVDNVLDGLEAAFIDIGLEKNGFLHIDEIVLPGVDIPRRGRGQEGGKRISEILKPGMEVDLTGLSVRALSLRASTALASLTVVRSPVMPMRFTP